MMGREFSKISIYQNSPLLNLKAYTKSDNRTSVAMISVILTSVGVIIPISSLIFALIIVMIIISWAVIVIVSRVVIIVTMMAMMMLVAGK